MTVLASGSRGNCTVITGGKTRVLVDAGVSCREILRRMAQAGEDPQTLDAILITHEHQDHVQGLSVLARRLGIPVFFTEATHRAWLRWMTPQKKMSYSDWLAARKAEAAVKAAAALKSGMEPEAEAANPFYRERELAACAEELAEETGEQVGKEIGEQSNVLAAREGDLKGAPDMPRVNLGSQTSEDGAALSDEQSVAPVRSKPAVDPCALPAVEYFKAGKSFSIGELTITAFTIPHDAADPVGFVVEGEGVRVGFATDLGYMPANVAQQLRRCDVMLLESNHDVEMLRDGPYPWSVKQRVLSRVGHLSNHAAAEFLEKGYDGQAAYVVLAHLSESNNLPELARVSAEWALRDRMNLIANKLVIARQHEATESICL